MQKKVAILKITFLWMVLMGLFPVIGQSQAFTDGTIDAGTTPVHLISFSGNKISNTVQVKWTTTNEVNNSHFNVQRSVNATNFTTIGKVLGKGSMAGINNYAFTDTATPNTTLYYRLQQVDVDGKTTLSAMVVIKNEHTPNTMLSIYPNPIKGSTVSLCFANAPVGAYTVNIKNVNGVSIYRQAHNQVVATTNSQLFLGSKPASGWYVLTMMNVQGVIVASKTFIVE
jgi:hypothetical protein